MNKLISIFCCFFIAFSAIASTDEPHPHYSNAFPPEGGLEYEQSVITIPIYDTNVSKKSPVEILKLTAFMRLDREVPYTNGLGYRQVEFTIADWELYGYSEYLDADVTFTLSEMPVQPKSLVVSLQESSDYPANIIYSAVYDVWIGKKRVVKNKPGIAFTKNVYEIPPRNVSVAFQKPTTLTQEHAELFGSNSMYSPGTSSSKSFSADVLSSSVNGIKEGGTQAGVIEFRDGTCEDMLQISKLDYDIGKKLAYSVRAGTTSLKDTYYSH